MNKNLNNHIAALKDKYALEFVKTYSLDSCEFIYDAGIFNQFLVVVGRDRKNEREFLRNGKIILHTFREQPDGFETEKTLLRDIGAFVYLPFCYNEKGSFIVFAEAVSRWGTVIKKFGLQDNSIGNLTDETFGNNVRMTSSGECIFISDFADSQCIYCCHIDGKLVKKINFRDYNHDFPLEIAAWDEENILISFGNQHIFNAKKSLNSFAQPGVQKQYPDSSLVLWNVSADSLEPLVIDDNIWPRFLHRQGPYLWASNYSGELVKYRVSGSSLETVFKVDLKKMFPFNHHEPYSRKFRMFIDGDRLYIYFFAESNELHCFRI